MIDEREHARLQAVEAAAKALLAEKGHIRRAELAGALAAQAPLPPGAHNHSTPWVPDEPWH